MICSSENCDFRVQSPSLGNRIPNRRATQNRGRRPGGEVSVEDTRLSLGVRRSLPAALEMAQ